MIEPADATERDGPTARSIMGAMIRGGRWRCPACGAGRLFTAYLKVTDRCPACGEDLHHQRADDAPPYVTIFVVGHIMVPLILLTDMRYDWPMWIEMLVWLPLVAGLSLALLPAIKGSLIGLQWALRMHGFGDPAAEPSSIDAARHTAV